MTAGDDPVTELLGPLLAGGGVAYLGEPVTQSAHACQAAALAEAAGASDELVVAALLHDIGWLTGGRDEDHAERGGRLLARWLPAAVSEPVHLHVEAKRWLCATDAAYHDHLSDASKRTLTRQGGPMTPPEAEAWIASPWAADAVRLRRWDDEAKEPDRVVPDLGHWAPLLDGLLGGRP